MCLLCPLFGYGLFDILTTKDLIILVREAPILNLSGYTSHNDHNLNLSQCFLASKMFGVDYLSSVPLWEHKNIYTF
jgi:hypothetical protein